MSAAPCTAAVLTPPGRGAIATIQIQGTLSDLQARIAPSPERFFQPRNGRQICEQPVDHILFGQWGEEELVACRTSTCSVEIHCHGGPAAIGRILEDLEFLGAEILPRETDSVSIGHSRWLSDLETAVVQARTFRAAEFLWSQRPLLSVWERCDQILQENGPLPTELRSQLIEASRWSLFGQHLTQPWQVVIGGAPNAGKSSLINALLGYERAIVYDQPGTTRDAVKAETAIDGWPVMLSDTAGQRASSETIEAAGIEIARTLLQSADLAVILIDRSAPSDSDIETLLQAFPNALVVFNKCDQSAHADWTNREFDSTVLEVSCRDQTGLEELLTTITEKLVPALPAADTLIPVTATQLHLLQQSLEIPAEN